MRIRSTVTGRLVNTQLEYKLQDITLGRDRSDEFNVIRLALADCDNNRQDVEITLAQMDFDRIEKRVLAWIKEGN
jgi:hypothetical protein